MGYHFHQGRWVLRRQSRESVVLKFPCRYLLKHSAVPENPALAKERSFFSKDSLAERFGPEKPRCYEKLFSMQSGFCPV